MTPMKHDGSAPYAPPRTVIDLIEGYRERGFATPFTPDVLIRAGVPQGLVNRVLGSLRILGLLDENGNPTEQLELLKRARGEEEYKGCLQEWLRATYAEVLQFADPAVDGPERLTEAFRGFTPEGQRSRMVTLMVGLFRHAGLVSDVPKRAAASRPKPRAAKTAGAASANTAQRGAKARFYGGSVPQSSYAFGMSTEDVGLAPALIGLLQQIPKGPNASWTQERRQAFLQAFTATLDYVVAVNAAPVESAWVLRDVEEAESS